MITTDCDKCGCRDVFLRKKGSQTGIYCDGCGRWYKWLGKKDIEAYTRRGFKVFPENYEPPNLANPVEPVNNPEPLIGVPLGQDGAGMSEDQFVPSLDSVSRRNSLQHNVPFESDAAVKSSNPLKQHHEPVPEHLSNFDPCPVCATGVLETVAIADNISTNIFQGVLFIYNRDNTTLHGSFKLKFCPECGVKL